MYIAKEGGGGDKLRTCIAFIVAESFFRTASSDASSFSWHNITSRRER
jgi:hypothetical protein